MQIQAPPNDRLARGLGWFSIGLGVAQLTAPKQVARAIGIRPHRRSRAALLAVGVREIAAGLAILSVRRPATPLWGRVAGDVMDLALLGAALRSPRSENRRVLGALGAVAGVLALDALAGVRNSRRARPAVAAVTINRSPEEVSSVWESLKQRRGVFFTLQSLDQVQLRPAPGGRGTEVTVHVDSQLDAVRVRNDLRRMKQVIEVGEVVHSDASIHPGLHAARPPREEELR